jgi:hypothetical protein
VINSLSKEKASLPHSKVSLGWMSCIYLPEISDQDWFDYCDLIERKITTKHKIHHCTKPGDTV